ncbi:MAG TPA: hypothetical protein VLN26_07275, partial [Gaiellaceae bacterium]|nr:hypothetical protein [Gaiellaceae bacterium]
MSGGRSGQKAGVKGIRPATAGEWSDAHAASADATFFHGPVWSAVWESYTHGTFRASPLLVEFEDDATAVIGATTVPTRIPGLRRTLLSPAGNCGGWVSRDALTPTHAAALADTITGNGPVLWRRHPQDTLACGVAIPGSFEEFTQVVDLRDGAD